MGMSASQARLLSITSRISDIEFKSQQISNVKIRLADESEKVANAYTQALNKQKLVYTTFNNGSVQNVNLTVNELMKSNSPYRLKAANGKMLVSSDIKNNYQQRVNAWNTFANPNYNSTNKDFENRMRNSLTDRRKECEHEFVLQAIWGIPSWTGCYNKFDLDGSKGGYTPMLEAGLGTQEQVDYYTELFSQLFAATTPEDEELNLNTKLNPDALLVLDDSCLNDPNWLYEAIESGEFMLVSVATNEEVSVSGEVSLQMVSDSTGMAKAEAEYNAATAKINSKEKKLDNELKKLDTEHNALNTEFDSVKSLIGDNVEKSFNLFS